jgi:ATP-binding cassette subfamily B protein
VRLFQSGGHFGEAYGALRARLRGERLALLREQSAAELAVAALGYGVYGAALLWLVARALGGEYTMGQLVLLAQSFFYGQRLLRASLENVNSLYANSLFLGHLYEFLELQPAVVSAPDALPPPALQQSLEFRNVTFRYAGAASPALHNFNLVLPAGRITAIVGPNGAGKSTLLKLACRLYDPEAGSVTWDGADLRALQLNELRRNITVLFQEPVHYNATAAENVALGGLPEAPDAARVREALRSAGADAIVDALPLRELSMLGKRFAGGAELSVGEWQRLCLARAFYRRAPLLLLDEPTSAMDSWAENEWMARFAALAAGRTVLLITHRFTTAMRADIIHVMQHGQIVESGNHAQLLDLGGLYAASWKKTIAN